MNQLGLIGYPLIHSFSKQYFNEKFKRLNVTDWYYENHPLKKIAELKALLQKNPDLKGLNVTMPYKAEVIPFLHFLDDDAAAVEAVNTIKIEKNTLTGYNTDIYGFEKSLIPLLNPQTTNAIVLGNGGAAKAVTFVLNKLGMSYITISRKKTLTSITYEELKKEHILNAQLIINTTPLGMLPQLELAPMIDYNLLNSQHLLYDLIYNPEETTFLKLGKKNGARIKTGLEMLHLQAEKSWEIWNL